jgi:hypothetical protein
MNILLPIGSIMLFNLFMKNLIFVKFLAGIKKGLNFNNLS